MEKKNIAILGSTGSIGTQTLEVIESHPEAFNVEVLTGNGNADLLISQALKFKPNAVVIRDETKYKVVKDALFDEGIKVYAGDDAISQVVEMDSIDTVVAAIVGYAGLKSTLSAIRAGKQIALANKETLVVAGDIVTAEAKKHAVNIYPVDSEHSAIFQCLTGEFHNPVEKIILTASGGPFRGKSKADLQNVTPENALKHPNWTMGAKVTIDSASLMNKGLEVIEAKWLFGLKPSQIEVIVHPQSIVHSLIQFTDGSIKAQLGLPDMKLPIQYALSYPKRLKSDFPRFSFIDFPTLSFEKPDTETFRNLALAFKAMEKGGNQPCVMNASNELVVQAFLEKKISFNEMPDIIERCMDDCTFNEKPGYDDYVESDREAREITKALLQKLPA